MMSSGNGMESSGRGGGGGVGVAPFVAKTYAMVDDPATDGAVGWGRAGNSFVVADPFAFSHALFPAHFKHSNFSSFVRQLNTYGFRKVDPDRWEFAHASFLRGQTHLLRHVVRRPSRKLKDDGSSTMSLAMEVTRLKQEQRATQDRLADMWRRVQETERRPLLKVAGDPDVLRRLVGDSSCFHGGPDEGAEAKRPRMLLGGEVQRVGKKKMSSVDADGLLYDINLQEEVYVPEPSVDFTGFYAGADGFCDVLVDGGY